MKLRFLCVGGFTCSVWSTLWNAKHEPPRWSGGMPPRKFLKNAYFEIGSGVFWGTKLLCKDRLWKSAVREISLAMHANPSPRSSWELRFKRSDSCASSVIFASYLFSRLSKPIKQILFSFTGLVLVLLPLPCVHTWWLALQNYFFAFIL